MIVVWRFGCHFSFFPKIRCLIILESDLTNSYFSEGWLNHQTSKIWGTQGPFPNLRLGWALLGPFDSADGQQRDRPSLHSFDGTLLIPSHDQSLIYFVIIPFWNKSDWCHKLLMSMVFADWSFIELLLGWSMTVEHCKNRSQMILDVLVIRGSRNLRIRNVHAIHL